MGVEKGKEPNLERTLADIAEARSPCSHSPGSEGKIRIIRIRLANKLPLFVLGDEKIPMHPKDQLRQKRGMAEDNEYHCEFDNDDEE